ncbi:tetratricopeptide (TPR) repeat protein [Desulfobaculum xiamenense]|uniref:Tetratricopeptide (TPR) repeat protein n=1 Tax=Desulfobaculum xiamenense TaxID=995050 RepID=A0A846QKF7_9BACT|nr:tetratricopeptide repeat protein [Desulfobaculum xiamenense]NJB66942.1 tetratricopeptide (TPR) repeat protein [Desulfobaculum xiamenense]
MSRLLTLPLATALAATLCSCATLPDTRPADEPVVWELTDHAEITYQFMRFDTARRLGRHEDAEAALARLLELAPSPHAFLEGANYFWHRNRIDETRDILKTAIATYPDNRDLALTLATTYFAEKRFDAAELTIRDYLRTRPDDWVAHRELAVVLIEARRFAQAIDVIEGIPDEEKDAQTLYYGAKASAGLGLNRQAIGMLYRAVEIKSDFVEAWAEMAYLFEVERDYVAAEETYGRILELGETGGEVWLRLISLNLKMNNPDKALELYRQGPTDMNFALEAATMFLEQKFYDHARSVLTPLPQTEGAPTKIWFYLALLAYEGDQDPAQALDYLNRIPSDDPLYGRAISFRVQLLLDTDRTPEALRLVRRVKTAHPTVRDYWLLEAHIHETLGDFAQARATLEKALEQWIDDTELLYSLGITLDKLGMRDKGVEMMERIISIDPEHSDALNFVGYTLADEGRDLDRAMVLINKALEADPESGFIIDSLAWLYFRLGDNDKAWAEIQRAVERVADDPTIWEHYGDIARAVGDTEKAREGYRNSLELRPDTPAIQKKLDTL